MQCNATTKAGNQCKNDRGTSLQVVVQKQGGKLIATHDTQMGDYVAELCNNTHVKAMKNNGHVVLYNNPRKIPNMEAVMTEEENREMLYNNHLKDMEETMKEAQSDLVKADEITITDPYDGRGPSEIAEEINNSRLAKAFTSHGKEIMLTEAKKDEIISVFNGLVDNHIRLTMKEQFIMKFGTLDKWDEKDLPAMRAWVKRNLNHLLKSQPSYRS